MKFFVVFVFAGIHTLWAQSGGVQGRVATTEGPLAFAHISVKGDGFSKGTVTDATGDFRIKDIPFGEYILRVGYVGFRTLERPLVINEKNNTVADLILEEDQLSLEQVVVTGTRTAKHQTESAVIVNLIDSKTLDQVQACNLAEGLRFQPGLRVETDCQTCNYTQLRMNGLGGGYSQILINGRPIFSPLTGLYGMEQIPANMIDRIEVVRGGGSALYGSSAIGGTVNLITKVPKENDFSVGYAYQSIGGNAHDNMISGNATALTEGKNAGATFYVNRRMRDYYDANGDNFSELPELKNNTFGTTLFLLPTPDQKLEVNVSSIYEYRYGGEMVDGPAYLAQQAEERTHNVLMGSVDYQINFDDYQKALIFYAGGQHTDRDHYTGIFPDDPADITTHLEDPPYGTSTNSTYQTGAQYNHRLNSFIGGEAVFTVGTEFVYDAVLDVIDAYAYKVDQITRNYGVFAQQDWQVSTELNVLAGFRVDKHNLLDYAVFSPRVSVLFEPWEAAQLRATWGTGFRAPKAFDADMHIAFAGGGVSRITLAPDLQEERSNSFSGSINYDKATENFIAGFTLEGFYTHLDNAFYLQPLGEDQYGERFQKQNGSGATVKGLTLETRANFGGVLQLEAGYTLQSSLYDEAVENIEGLPAKREFMRTPNDYGYLTAAYTPDSGFSASLNLVHTGQMELPHFAGAPEQTVDAYETTESFTELGLKLGYTFRLPDWGVGMECYGGIKNMTDAYQKDFDSGKDRDSNYVYGPSAPRTYFAGLRFKSM